MKFLALIFTLLLCLFLILPAFPQQVNAVNLVKHYNIWLKLVHLEKIVIADSFLPTPLSGKVDTSINYVLLLKPKADYAEADRFAMEWGNAKEQLQKRGINIYNLLLTKLVDYSFISPRHLVIRIQSNNENIFSVLIKYDTDMIVSENIIGSRDRGSKLALNMPVNEMNEHCFNISQPGKLNKIRCLLDEFFKKYRHGSTLIRIDSMIYHNRSKIHLRVSNVYGQITGKNYHEVIYLDVDIDQEQICYTVDATYAAGIVNVPDPESGFYREVALDFPQQWLNYRDKLEIQLKALLYGK